MQICAVAEATDEEILSLCNKDNPSGTESGWSMVIRAGAGAPVVCEKDPARKHFLVVC